MSARATSLVDARIPTPPDSRVVITIAWVVTALVSTLPGIAWVELSGSRPDWLPVAQVGVLLVLLVGSVLSRTVRPLRPFAIVMIAFFILIEIRPTLDLRWAALQAAFGGSAFDDRMQAEQTGKFLVSLAMIGVLLVLGYSRRGFFLTRGDLRAPIRPVRLLGFPRSDPWSRFGLQWGLYIAVALTLALYLSTRPPTGVWGQVLPMVPSIVFYAALNAFNEEMTYRAPMLATLEPSEGSTQSLWQAATFFGVAHYFGTPGGLLGAALSVFMGWILGKAMVETRGMFWAWWIHFLSDVVIFTFLAVDLVTA